ncbi:MAG: hypothetical protein COB36_11490 [Alphaproteobacteria bacterium]|nr:MAG: hypothetical protein COB36_11490 [Alphaproteobacteria bacterium]
MRIPLIFAIPLTFLQWLAAASSLIGDDTSQAMSHFSIGLGIFMFFYLIGIGLVFFKGVVLYFRAKK